MNIKEGIKRIYIVAAVLWAFWFCFLGIADKDILGIMFGILPPVLIYFVALWIYKGFINK